MLNIIRKINTDYKLSVVAPFFTKAEKVLDFGCGDLLLDEALFKANNKLKIIGVDVVDFNRRPQGIKFCIYDGNRLPFKDKTFDTVLAYHVFHHCDSPLQAFKECFRAARKRIIVVEPVYRIRTEIPIMSFMDWIYNVWKSKSISMKYQFLSKKQWYEIFRQHHLDLQKELEVDNHPFWLPIGRAYLFLLRK